MTEQHAASGPCIVVACGGSAGHIYPGMAFADAMLRVRPNTRIVVLGTERGLETTLIPGYGYPLELVDAVPLPRKPTPDLFRVPLKVREAIRQTRAVFERVDAEVVVGFGGYTSLPAYLAARGRLPVVVHEANARAGIANKVGAKFAARVAAAVPGTGLPKAEVIGNPLRESITKLDRTAMRAEAKKFFGLDPDAPTLFVSGGSQGARTLNVAASGAARAFADAGIGVLHAYGARNSVAVQAIADAPPYIALPYVERMDLAYAAADLFLCRAGMNTVAEASAVGLPAVFVPLPIGNGEQALNAKPVVQAGGGLLIPDEELTTQKVIDEIIPLLTDKARLAVMSNATRSSGHREAADVLARIVLEVVNK